MSRALIPRESMEGALKLQVVRRLTGEPIELATALSVWKRMGTQRQEQVVELWQMTRPIPKWPGPPYKFQAVE